jgi:hypothetical protein
VNALTTTMSSAITKERTTSCYFLGTVTSIESGASNAASDWAGSCVIIIERPRNLAEKSRMILWLEADCTSAKTTMCW